MTISIAKQGKGFEVQLAVIATLSIVALAAILLFLLSQALPLISEVPMFSFFFGTEWYPTPE